MLKIFIKIAISIFTTEEKELEKEAECVECNYLILSLVAKVHAACSLSPQGGQAQHPHSQVAQE